MNPLDSVYIKAHAKINLAIRVVGKRADGYHELDMIMQSVGLYDGLTIRKIDKAGYLKLASDASRLPTDERNIVYKAASYMKTTYDIKSGVFIGINKRIPISAGLGGGSADCAAAIIGIRKLFSLPVSDRDALEIAGKFGSDAPFCVFGGTARAQGAGEKLTKLSPVIRAYALLVRPHTAVSTADVFKKFKTNHDREDKKPDIEKLARKITAGEPLRSLAPEFKNELETVTAEEHPIIEELKQFLVNNGAAGALMSGSGATVFGLFEKKADAGRAAAAVRTAFPAIRDIILTKTI